MSEFQEISDGLENVGEGIARLQADNARLRALNEELVGALKLTTLPLGGYASDLDREGLHNAAREARRLIEVVEAALSKARAKGGSHG